MIFHKEDFMMAEYNNFRKRLWRVIGPIILLVVVWGVAAEGAVEQTAEVRALRGEVLGTTSARGTFPAEIGLSLSGGDAIETLLGANATLALSAGSEITLNEQTKLSIQELIQDEVTSARKSRVKLLAGKMRAELSAGAQGDGSAFTVETPNTLVAVKFSRPIVVISYDPTTQTTIIDAHTVDIIVTNLNTMATQQFSRGQQVVVQQDIMTSTAIPDSAQGDSQDSESEDTPTTETDDGTDTETSESNSTTSGIPTQVNTVVFVQIGGSIRGATSSTVPTSVGAVGPVKETETPEGGTTESGGGAETSSNPSPGTRPERPERERRVFTIYINRE